MCGECKIFGHATSLCPSKPITQGHSKLKQEWKAKEIAEMKERGKPNEWVKVKEIKAKGVVDASMVKFVPTPSPSSSNAFDILKACVANEGVSFCADLKSVLNANEDILNVKASKEEKEIVGKVGNIHGSAPRLYSRSK